MAKIKYENKEYSVRDYNCKKLINKCFIPFSGNGQNICRKYELGRCPSEEEIASMPTKPVKIQTYKEFTIR